MRLIHCSSNTAIENILYLLWCYFSCCYICCFIKNQYMRLYNNTQNNHSFWGILTGFDEYSMKWRMIQLIYHITIVALYVSNSERKYNYTVLVYYTSSDVFQTKSAKMIHHFCRMNCGFNRRIDKLRHHTLYTCTVQVQVLGRELLCAG